MAHASCPWLVQEQQCIDTKIPGDLTQKAVIGGCADVGCFFLFLLFVFFIYFVVGLVRQKPINRPLRVVRSAETSQMREMLLIEHGI